MNSESKKCPMCAEEIPLVSVTCQYCDAQFKVTSSGYCQTCHEVREADENGQCRTCGSAVVDLRVESRFIEESAQELLPVAQSVAQPEKSRAGKRWLPIGILAGILIFAVIVASLWFGRDSVPAISSPIATSTPKATITSTPTLAPTTTSTNTPRPTPTVTPLPAWVSDFAEPILLEIANRFPTIQDGLDKKPYTLRWMFHAILSLHQIYIGKTRLNYPQGLSWFFSLKEGFKELRVKVKEADEKQ